MKAIKNQVIKGSSERPIILDAFWEETKTAKPIVIFAHGFKGFKDWGCWDLVGKRFAEAGFVFVKFNFSHNGTTLEDPLAFGDLEAFGQNNYSKELDDLGSVIDLISAKSNDIPAEELNAAQIHLVGHSRGGGVVLLKAAEDDRVTSVSAWAAISSTDRNWTASVIKQWKEDGVFHVMNGRTKQNMPLYFQLYEDVQNNKERLNIEANLKASMQALQIIHGTTDPAVSYETALELKSWKPSAELVTIEGADHVFGGKHPWTENTLPADLDKVVKESVRFFKGQEG